MKSELTWTYHIPEFECDSYNLHMMKYSPWSGHRLFAYDYISAVKPGTIVELGSFYGCSSFCFLQAVKDHKLETEFYAIDTWEGDSFTQTDYNEDIYHAYKNIQDHCYAGLKANMLRMEFDEAAVRFPDASIDLLHIDGSHLYDDVLHDFNMWKSKVKKTGVIFFHDISDDLLNGRLTGSYRFWNELKDKSPYTIEFPYSFGLGVLFFDSEMYKSIANQIDFDYYQRQSNHESVLYKDTIRKQFFEIRDLKKQLLSLSSQIDIKEEHLNRYSDDVSKKEDYIQELLSQISDLESTCRANDLIVKQLNESHQEDIKALNALVESKETYITELSKTVSDYKKDSETRNAYITQLEEERAAHIDTIQDLMTDISRINSDYSHNIQTYEDTAEENRRYIEELQQTISAYVDSLDGKERYIAELEKGIENYSLLVEGKESYINELLDRISNDDSVVKEKMAIISALELDMRNAMMTQTKDVERIQLLQKENREIQDSLILIKNELEKTVFGRIKLRKMGL